MVLSRCAGQKSDPGVEKGIWVMVISGILRSVSLHAPFVFLE